MEQICFFDPVKELTFDDKINELKERLEKMRRGFFKRYDIYQKEVENLEKDIDNLVDAMVSGKCS